MSKKNICIVCNKSIPKERIAALKLLGKSEDQWTHVQCSFEQKKSGIYFGEQGSGELKIVDKIYDDDIHSIFGSSERTDDE